MTEPEQITAARRQWVEDVKALSPAARDGLIQSIMDSAYALGLVVVPKERVVPVFAQIPMRGAATNTFAEMKQRQLFEAAMAIGQEIVAAELAEPRGFTHISGQRDTRFRVLVIRPEPVASGEKPAEPLLSSTAPATLTHR